MLVDSQLIIDYLESLSDEAGYVRALNVIGTAMVVNEKTVQLIYELEARPADVQHAEWIERLQRQLIGAIDMLEKRYGEASNWLFGDEISQVDVTTAIAWRFVQFRYPDRVPADAYPALGGLSARAEALPVSQACSIE